MKELIALALCPRFARESRRLHRKFLQLLTYSKPSSPMDHSDTEGVSMYLFYDVAVAYLAGVVGRYSGVVTPDPLETLEEIRNDPETV